MALSSKGRKCDFHSHNRISTLRGATNAMVCKIGISDQTFNLNSAGSSPVHCTKKNPPHIVTIGSVFPLIRGGLQVLTMIIPAPMCVVGEYF